MKKNALILLVFTGLFFCGGLAAAAERVDLPELKTVSLHLDNGMKVLIKKTSSKEDVNIRLTALGGYSSLPESQRASGKFASQIATRSGIGPYHFDKLHALLYDRSMEFNTEVLPFSRHIEGSAFVAEMDKLLDIIRLFFTEHHFDKQSFNKVMGKAKEQIQHRTKHSSRQLEDTYLSFVTDGNSSFIPLTMRDIENADFQQSKNFFDNSFRDPSEFVCVIVGAFDLDDMVALVEKRLGMIPKVEDHQSICKIPDLTFPEMGIRKKVVKNIRNDIDAMTRMTFPVHTEMVKEDFAQVENLAHLIKLRVKDVLRKRYGKDSVFISVSTEYPYYPCLCTPWITIQYHTEHNLVTPMGQTIIAEIQNLQKGSATEDEIATMSRKYRQTQKIREKDNSYWVMILSNYGLWGWELNDLSKDLSPVSDPEKIHKNFRTFISLKNYIILSAS